jgi:hypothetical protein
MGVDCRRLGVWRREVWLENVQSAGRFAAWKSVDQDYRLPWVEQRIGEVEATDAGLL